VREKNLKEIGLMVDIKKLFTAFFPSKKKEKNYAD
jgi:hypothetical protein